VSLLPDVWAKNTGGVDFSVNVTTHDGRQVARNISVNPGRRPADRRWQRFTLPVPVDREQDVTVALSTAVPAGGHGDHAWAIWGEPAIERRLRLAAIWARVRRRIGRARGIGLRATYQEWLAGSRTDNAAWFNAGWLWYFARRSGAWTKMRDDAERLPRPVISVITPVFNTDPRWLRACIESLSGRHIRTGNSVCATTPRRRQERGRCSMRKPTPESVWCASITIRIFPPRRMPRSASPRENSSHCSIMTTN
jgi:hypothetical protein